MKKKIVFFSSTILFLGLIYLLVVLFVPKIIDKSHNKVRVKGPYILSERTNKMYNSLNFVADMHCDALLWKRNLLKDNDFGQVDIPKMISSNIGLQAFTIVTKSPKDQNFSSNTGDSDRLTSLFFAQGRPTSSLLKRALLQCRDLYNYAEKSKGKFRVISDSMELQEYLKERSVNNKITAGFIGIEGAHALDGKLENLQILYDYGVRMMSPTHFFDNKLGGSAHGISKAGLTDFGKMVIKGMDELNMIIDVAHCSAKLIDDVILISNRPILSSHTGVKGTCNNNRNLSDRQIKAIAKSGGLICIAFFKQAVCGTDAEATAKAIQYTANLVGVNFVALGSDFDGSVITPFDITGMPLIVEELIKLDFSEEEIQKIMGGNIKEFLLRNLPPGVS